MPELARRFPLTVLLLTEAFPPARTIPLPCSSHFWETSQESELAVMVLFVTVKLPLAWRIPPPDRMEMHSNIPEGHEEALATLFPLTVVSKTVKLPAL
jgi:hypothetical protein